MIIEKFSKDQKLKHMAELQLSVVSDPESKHQIEVQIQQWDENLERLCCEQFRLRCYMASLQNGELPNPKVMPIIILKYHIFKNQICKIHLISMATNFNYSILGSSYPSDTYDKRNFKQTRSLYGLIIPCVHLRKKSISIKQSPCRKRGY